MPRRGISPSALSEAQKAVQMDPSRPETFLNLAVIQEKSKDVKRRRTKLSESRFAEPEILARPALSGNFLSAPEALVGCGKAVSSRDCCGSEKRLASRVPGWALLSEGKLDAAEKVSAGCQERSRGQSRRLPDARRILFGSEAVGQSACGTCLALLRASQRPDRRQNVRSSSCSSKIAWTMRRRLPTRC